MELTNGLRTSAEDKMSRMLILSFLIMLLGIKLLLIQYAGFPQPVWDQWDAQAVNLYIPYLDGNLTLGALFEPHNEHRIFTTRVLSLGLLSTNGQWDPILEMVVNSIIHIAAFLMFVKIISEISEKKFTLVVFLVGSVIWMLPFGWDNSLSGFQSQFYFLLVFSFVSLYFITQHAAFSKWWTLGIILSLLAVFSMASGSIIYLAICGYTVFSMIFHRRKSKSEIITLVVCMLLFLAAISITPKIDGHEPLKAQSIYAFLLSFCSAAAWPFINMPPLAIIVWAPAVIWFFAKIRTKGSLTVTESYLVLVSFWVLLQASAFAYSRGANGTMPVSKYMDILLIMPLLNALFTVRTLDLFYELKGFYSKAARYLAFVWFFIMFVGMFLLVDKNSVPGIKDQKHYGEIQLSAMRQYIYSNNEMALRNQPFRHIPYPDADRMISILGNQELRSILPSEFSSIGVITDLSSATGFVVDGFYPFVGRNNFEPAVGSYGSEGDASKGEYRSPLLQPSAKYIEIPFSGYLGEDGINAYMETETGRKIELKMKRPPKEKWKTLVVNNPGEPFRIVLSDQSIKYWIGMSTPKALGALSHFARKLVAISQYIFLLGFILLLWHLGPRLIQKLEKQ